MDLIEARRRLLMMDSSKAYTVTGNPVSFETNLAKPLKGMVIPFTPIQSGTGDPSPSNVRPITGWDGVTVYHSGADTSNPTSYPISFPAVGKNLFDQGHYQWASNLTPIFVPIYVGDGTFTMSTDFPNYNYKDVFILPGITTSGWSSDENGVSVTTPRTVTSVDGYITVANRYTASRAKPSDYNWQIEKGSSATSYEPFNNTIYGGYVDLAQGVVTVEWVSLTKTWGDFRNKTLLGDNTRGVYSISSFPSLGTGAGAVCNIAPRKLEWSQDVAHFYTNEGSCIVILPNDTANSTEIQVVYPIATPYEIQLDPLTVQTLIGDNTIWTDTNGTNTVTYLKRG